MKDKKPAMKEKLLAAKGKKKKLVHASTRKDTKT